MNLTVCFFGSLALIVVALIPVLVGLGIEVCLLDRQDNKKLGQFGKRCMFASLGLFVLSTVFMATALILAISHEVAK